MLYRYNLNIASTLIFGCRPVSIIMIPKLCLSVCPFPRIRNPHSFVNISPALVIDTSMERSSRVIQHGNPKNLYFFQRKLKLNFNHYSFVNISPTLVIDTSMERSSLILQHRNLKICIFFSKKV